MNCGYYQGMVEISGHRNISSITKKILNSKDTLSKESKFTLLKSTVKKHYELELFSEIPALYKGFGIDIFELEGEFYLYSYVRSLSRNEEFEKLKEVSENIDYGTLKKYREEIVRFTARAFTLTGDYARSHEILQECKEFKCCMLELYNYSLVGDYNSIVKKIIEYRDIFKGLEENLHMNFFLAEELFKTNKKKDLKKILRDIRKAFYHGSEEYIMTRSLALHKYISAIGERVEAFSYLEYAINFKSLSKMELENKCEILRLLVEKYRKDPNEVVKLSLKEESLENIGVINSLKLQEETL